MEKLNLTQQKYAFTNQKKCTTTQNKYNKLKPGLVASYNIRPGNREGIFLFWHFINVSLTNLLRHLSTYFQPMTHMVHDSLLNTGVAWNLKIAINKFSLPVLFLDTSLTTGQLPHISLTNYLTVPGFFRQAVMLQALSLTRWQHWYIYWFNMDHLSVAVARLRSHYYKYKQTRQ